MLSHALRRYYATPRSLHGLRCAHSDGGHKLFDKILVANRGEIACRVMRTAERMGIRTVAVHSEADRDALHVRNANEAVCIGPAASAQSYLVMDRVIEAAKMTGANAVHPGYGFLSENALFAKRLEDEGITFIGPKTFAIEAMGDKIHSKKLAREAGVNTIPGFLGEVHDNEEVLKIANEIGYPVMIKASAGGGGKGMRIAFNDKEAIEGFRLSKEEAKASFGDDRIFIEKYFQDPRHIEFQVLADAHGNAVYLPERECSIQRRNQKVIEEAPCAVMTPELRQRMGEQAVALAKAVGYQSAGTVEFLVDPQQNFAFLEMNTRLQVEHPITEYITKLDLVEHMIRIAAGEKLSVTQSDIGIHGWAIESRVYAEDPLRGFLPSVGRLTKYREPQPTSEVLGQPNVRVDSGVYEGGEIPIYYDPMISKLCSYGETRDEAIASMRDALDSYVIDGLRHNITFLRAVMDHEDFIAGNTSTKFIEKEYPDGFHGYPLSDQQKRNMIAIGALAYAEEKFNGRMISDRLGADANDEQEEFLNESMFIRVNDGEYHNVNVSADFGEVVVSVDGERVNVQSVDNSVPHVHSAVLDNDEHVAVQLLARKPVEYDVVYCGTRFALRILNEREHTLASYMKPKPKPDFSSLLVAPMPGKLVSVAVAVGDEVVEGQELAVVEAMKMQNVLRAGRSGKVKAIPVNAGENLSLDDVIVEFDS